MGRIEKTVFISYRRTNFYTALAVYQDLTTHGYDVFFDYQSIDSGNFEQVIFENISHRAHFVVILSPSALERCSEPGDWLRREIEMAMDENRNIIPLMMESFDFGSPAIKEALTGKLANINRFNGLRLVSDYFFEGMEKLRNRYLSVALENVPTVALSEEVEEGTEERQAKVSKESIVEEESLTAEKWFERGYQSQKENDLDEALRYYTEAIQLNPKLNATYNNLGALYSELKRYEEAEAAYRKAIELNPDDATAYSNLGTLLYTQERYSDAASAYEKVVSLQEDNLAVRTSLFGILKKLGKSKEAKEQEALLRELNQKENEYNRACFEALCGNMDEALTLLKIALEKGQSSKDWARQDPDLENLHTDKRFIALL